MWRSAMNCEENRYAYFFFSSRRRHTRYWRDWSSDVCSSDLLRNDQLGLVKKHSLMIFIGLFLCFLLSKFSYKNFQNPLMRKLLYFVPPIIFIGMMVAPSSLVPIRNGAKAWIQLGGFAIQPAELFKVSYIILLSNVLAKLDQEKHIKDYKLILSVGAFVFLPYAIFIHLQNDLGAIIHYALITG